MLPWLGLNLIWMQKQMELWVFDESFSADLLSGVSFCWVIVTVLWGLWYQLDSWLGLFVERRCVVGSAAEPGLVLDNAGKCTVAMTTVHLLGHFGWDVVFRNQSVCSLSCFDRFWSSRVCFRLHLKEPLGASTVSVPFILQTHVLVHLFIISSFQ